MTQQELADRAMIQDVVLKYATGVDRHDWTLYRSIFTDEVDIDFSSWAGTVGRMSADEWVAKVEAVLPAFDATQHNMTNFTITVDGDTATAVVYIVAHHALEGEIHRLGGYYTDLLQRVGNGWKIIAVRLTVTWEEGDRGLFARALARRASDATSNI